MSFTLFILHIIQWFHILKLKPIKFYLKLTLCKGLMGFMYNLNWFPISYRKPAAVAVLERAMEKEKEKEAEKLCKRCHQTYTSQSNTSSSCRFHPSFFVCRRHDDQKRSFPSLFRLLFHHSCGYTVVLLECFYWDGLRVFYILFLLNFLFDEFWRFVQARGFLV